MSAGGSVNYFGRPNKAIDRAAFVVLLQRVNAWCGFDQFSYYSLGGPFVEDCAAVARHFPFNSIVSLERESSVLERARANCPSSRVRIEHDDVYEFIERSDFDAPCVFWLDYSSPKEVDRQVYSIQALSNKLPTNSILKITLNASPDTLDASPVPAGSTVEDLYALRNGPFLDMVGNFVENDPPTNAFTRRGYPGLLSQAILYASRRGTHHRNDVEPIPLTSFTYADTKQQMLTVTLAIISESDRPTFLKTIGFSKWNLGWDGVRRPLMIREPSLSLRERLKLDRHLPDADTEELSDLLGYRLGNSYQEHEEILRSYKAFHGIIPYVAPVIL